MSDTFVQEKKFFDEKNYPHGFSRSGDYTVRESKVLEDYGTRLSLLAAKDVTPETPAEEHFVAVIYDDQDPDSFIEKTWLKYQRLITEDKRVYILADSVSQISTNEDMID